MKRRDRIAALIVSVMFCFVLLGSFVFIAQSTDHDCQGDDCAVCMAVSQLEQVTESLGRPQGGGVVLTAAVMAAAVIVLLAGVFAGFRTPIKLKVKLLN